MSGTAAVLTDADETTQDVPPAPLDPCLEIADHKFAILTGPPLFPNPAPHAAAIAAVLVKNNMAPMWEAMVASGEAARLGVTVPAASATAMREAYDAKLAEVEAAIKDAQAHAGESDVRARCVEKVEALHAGGASIDAAVADMVRTLGASVPPPQRIELYFMQARQAIAAGDFVAAAAALALAEPHSGSVDWERRNRLRLYRATVMLSRREFKDAQPLLTGGLPTFSSSELLSFATCVFRACVAALLGTPRAQLAKTIVTNTDVLAEQSDWRVMRCLEYARALHDCKYDAVLERLDALCVAASADPLLAPHVSFIHRQLRGSALLQYLAAYKSVPLAHMASRFGITPELLDTFLVQMVVARRAPLRLDKVAGRVVTYRPDARNERYTQLLQDGDALVNRLQKLLRAAEIA